MKEYYIDKTKSYYENRTRLVDEGHVMGLKYLPPTYEEFNKNHQELIYKFARKKSELSDHVEVHYVS